MAIEATSRAHSDFLRAVELANERRRCRPVRVDHARMAAEDALPIDRWADDGGR